MVNVFFTSDTHFNHTKVLTFEASSRPFATIEEHDEEIIGRWNGRVRPKDIVWHEGDLFLGKDLLRFHSIMKRLNGKKYLIRGNHDTLPTDLYRMYFEEIYGVWPKYGFVMSHVPLHPDSVDRWGLNVHGHMHSKKVKCAFKSRACTAANPFTATKEDWIDTTPDDKRYFCVSVEQHNLAPVSLDEIRKLTNQT